MNNWKITLTLSFTMLFASAFTAYGEVAFEGQSSREAAGEISGFVGVPETAPGWFKRGKINESEIVVRVEGIPEMPRMPFPQGYEEMTSRQKQAWLGEFRKSRSYKDYAAEADEAYRNRPIFEYGLMSPDTAYTKYIADGLKPGKYVVYALVPHTRAAFEDRPKQSWAYGYTVATISEEKMEVSTKVIGLKLCNVVMPNDRMPTITASEYDGAQVKLHEFRGKYTVLFFWSTWCGPCVAQIPELTEIYREFGSDRCDFIALNLDFKVEKAVEFQAENRLPYRQLYLGSFGANETQTRSLGINRIPSIWLIGRTGRVIGRDLSMKELREVLGRYVNEGDVKR